MKKSILIILIALVGCKKQKTEPEQINNTPPTIAVVSRTITIYSKAYAGNGTVIVNWGSGDSTYNYSLTQYLTRVIDKDSISLDFYCKSCSSCSFGANDVTVSVNSVVIKSYVNDWGNNKRWIKF